MPRKVSNALWASLVALQAAAEPPPPTHQLDTVVVTAQKRDELAQDVPISVQVFSAAELQAKDVTTTQQLGQLVPALQFTTQAGFPIVFLRGIGTDNFVPSADPSVATYIDGIYTPMPLSGVNELLGIRSVEVVKGPQGTLFGRNADGGAISIVTQNPGTVYHAAAEAQVGSMRENAERVSLEGPLTSWLSAGVWGATARQDNAYSDKYFAVEPDKVFTGRAKVWFHPSESFDVTLAGYRAYQSGVHNLIAKNVAPSPLGQLLGIRPETDDYNGQADFPTASHSAQDLVDGVAKWRTPWLDVKLLASYQHVVTPYSGADFDASPQPILALTGSNTFTNMETGELQLLSNDSSWDAQDLTWVAGVYYLQSHAGIDPGEVRLLPGAIKGLLNQVPLPGVPALGQELQDLLDQLGLANTPLGSNGLTVETSGVLGTRSISAYTQATYRFTGWLDLTLGGRLQHEDRYLVKAQTALGSPLGDNGSIPLASFPLTSAKAGNFSPKAVLSVRPIDGVLAYASYAVGFKSATYNIVNIFSPPSYVEPERVTAYEVGAKLAALQDTLRFDVALFDNEISHMQSGSVSLLSANAINFISVPHARSRGGEVDGKWVALAGRDPLVFSLTAAYVDATYTDFPNGPGYDKTSGLYSQKLDLTGDRIVYTPRWSGTAGVAQGLRGSEGEYELALDEYFNAGYYADAFNTAREGAFAVLNGRLGYRHDPWRLRGALFCENMLDRRYHAVLQQTDFGQIRSLAEPRQYGVRLDWEF